MKRVNRFDAVVVGSGAAGGWAAKKLTEAGLTVAVLEAGADVVPERDYTEHLLPYETPHRGIVLPREVREDQPIQSRCISLSAYNHSFFVSDTQNPYTTPPDQPFQWYRSRRTGGRTTVWGRVCPRFSDLDFKAASRDGFGVDWPLSYSDLVPYYDEVERFIGVSGTPFGLGHQPDGRFQPGMKLSCGERLLQTAIRKRFGRTLTISPSAVLTEDLPGRSKCHFCGPCERGCITRSFFSSVHSTLPAAAATGRLTLIPHAIVREVHLGKDGRARTVACVDAKTREEFEVEGRVIALCASTLESTRILLNSRSSSFPTGLGNSSDVLGRYLTDHLVVYSGRRHFPQLRGVRDTPGRRPVSYYIPRFRNVDRREAGFKRGYCFEGRSHEVGGVGPIYAVPGFGAALKNALGHMQPEWYLVMVAFGECLPWKDNRMTLDPKVRDAWGIPSARIEMTYRDNERAMAQDMYQTGKEMMDAAGAVGETPPPVLVPGGSNHEVGTARMGANPKESFLNSWNQSHDVKNLFVLDGAAFPSLPCQNPTLTIMALAARASDHIVAELKHGGL